MFALQGFFILAFPCIWFQWSPTKNLHPREALLHLGHQRIDCTWFRKAFYACSFTFCDHPSQFLIIMSSWSICSSQHPGWEVRTTIVPLQAYQSKHVCPNVYAQTFYGSSSNQTTVPFLMMSNGGTFFQWWNNLPGWRCICPKLSTCTLLLFNVGRGMM